MKRRIGATELRAGDVIYYNNNKRWVSEVRKTQDPRLLSVYTSDGGFSIWTHELIDWFDHIEDQPDPRDALIARLRTELAACHKTIIDAMAKLDDDTPIPELSGDDEYALHATNQIAKALRILDSAPAPDDETLAAIEATDTGGDDA